MISAMALLAAEDTRATTAVLSAAPAGAGASALMESRTASAAVAHRYTDNFILASSARTLACITSEAGAYGVFTLRRTARRERQSARRFRVARSRYNMKHGPRSGLRGGAALTGGRVPPLPLGGHRSRVSR